MPAKTYPIPQMKVTDDSGDEAAAAKLWAVYISEAEKYDRALVESWKSDMDGLLIFAALFSAIVAAFLIESYKTLNSNSGDLTVQLLTQISQQLAASANGSTFMVSPSTPFTPAATSLACNALWFLSLGFSLACALIATLVQQWAREFLHKAEMRSAPGVRARAFSYLYYGMKRFHMHTMVEVIPLLLHASLLVFFGGLIAFLIPVNLVMVKIVAIVLCIVAVVYLTLTLLPLECLDCPYRTPVSGAFWSILQLWKRFRYQHHHQATDVDVESGAETSSKTDETGSDSHSSMDETMVEAMFRTAWQPSAERSQRDHNALLWTLKSLSNDVELEPFVEAIPDVLWGPNNPRYTYAHHIGRLAQNPDVQLPSRIVSLLASCDAGILSPDVNIHRQITCFKGLWAIASLSTFDQSSEGSSCSVDFSDIIQHPAFSLRRSKAARLARPVQPNHGHHYHGHYHRPYIYMASPMDGLECYASTMALMLWSTFTAVKRDLDAIRDYIATKQRGVGAFNPESDPKVSSMYHTLESKILELKSDAAQNLTTKQTVEELVALMPFRILFEYLSNSASLAIAPYRWKETRAAISVDASVCSPVVQQELEDCLGTMINPQLMNHTVLDSDEIPWIDSAISQLLSLWHPENAEQIPRPIITILEKWPKKRLRDVLWEGGRVGTYLWSIFATILSSPDVREEDCATFWHLASAGFTVDRDDDKRLMHLESILAALSALPFVNWSNLIIPLIRIQIFEEVSHTRADATGEDLLSLFNDPRFPHDTAVQLPHDFLTMDPQQRKATYRDFMKHRVRETRIAILAELLEHCTSDVLPYHTAVEIISQWIPRSAIHPIHQVRLASSIHHIFVAGHLTKVMDKIIAGDCWGLYAKGAQNEEGVKTHREELERSPGGWGWWPWLDNRIAREKIKDVWAQYAATLTASAEDSTSTDFTGTDFTGTDSTDILSRLQKILQGLDSWHHESDMPGTGAELTGEKPMCNLEAAECSSARPSTCIEAASTQPSVSSGYLQVGALENPEPEMTLPGSSTEVKSGE